MTVSLTDEAVSPAPSSRVDSLKCGCSSSVSRRLANWLEEVVDVERGKFKVGARFAALNYTLFGAYFSPVRRFFHLDRARRAHRLKNLRHTAIASFFIATSHLFRKYIDKIAASVIKSSELKALDGVDRKILRIVQQDGRISLVDLSHQINLSPAATHARLRQLEANGYIIGYKALVNPEALGYDLTCFIQISFHVNALDSLNEFLDKIRAMPEVVECYKVTGEYDCLLKVMAHNHRDLDRFLTENLNRKAGVTRTHTSIAVNDVKLNGPIHIAEPDARDAHRRHPQPRVVAKSANGKVNVG